MDENSAKELEQLTIDIRDAVIKSFARSKKLTEGEAGFQQISLENINKIGEDQSPINVKAVISTMAPKENIGENNIQDPIEGDKQTSPLKKDYSKGLGAFSMQQQIPGEMINTVGYPVKVDAVEETKKRNPVTSNNETMFEKSEGISHELIDSDFFKAIDSLISDDEIIDLNKSITNTQSIYESLELDIYNSLKKSINTWYANIDKSNDIDSNLVELKKNLIKWQKSIPNESIEKFNILIDLGTKAYIRKSAVPVSKQFYDDLKIEFINKKLFDYSLNNFIDVLFKQIVCDLKSLPKYSFKQKKAIDEKVNSSRIQAKSLIKSEINNAGIMGITKAINLKK